MKAEITLDKFLSFWIILYSIGYVLKLFPYNPIILLGFAILVFVIKVIIVLYYYNKNSSLLYYFIINFFTKIPLFIIIYGEGAKLTNDDITVWVKAALGETRVSDIELKLKARYDSMTGSYITSINKD